MRTKKPLVPEHLTYEQYLRLERAKRDRRWAHERATRAAAREKAGKKSAERLLGWLAEAQGREGEG